ncbi:hypothetical protein KAK05_01145 [Candidatus Parcubacteria bacterium]|nr:hypothetical protein [Candidatus Parcubacteria bacterium]
MTKEISGFLPPQESQNRVDAQILLVFYVEFVLGSVAFARFRTVVVCNQFLLF